MAKGRPQGHGLEAFLSGRYEGCAMVTKQQRDCGRDQRSTFRRGLGGDCIDKLAHVFKP